MKTGDSLSDQRDRSFLQELAKHVRHAISQSDLPLAISGKAIYSTNTGGFSVQVAKGPTRHRPMRAELWFDLYAQPMPRRLWYGFTWPSRSTLRRTVNPARFNQRYVRDWSDTNWTRAGRFYHYKRSISDGKLAVPLLEIYGTGYGCFLGRYDLRRKSSRALVSEIVSFFSQFLQSDGSFIIGNSRLVKRERKTIVAMETRRLVKALVFDRSAAVARERKTQDRYIRQICSFNFAQVYPELGNEFAESHHLKPLGKRKTHTVQTSTRDLRTVCPNCHRMIHKAESHGHKKPFDYVRRIVSPAVRPS